MQIFLKFTVKEVPTLSRCHQFERHKKFVADYILYYGGKMADFKRITYVSCLSWSHLIVFVKSVTECCFHPLNPFMLFLSERKTKRIMMFFVKTIDSSGRMRMRKTWHGDHLESTSGTYYYFLIAMEASVYIGVHVFTFIPFGFILF